MQAKILFIMTEGKLTKEFVDSLILTDMRLLPDFRETPGNVSVLTWDRMSAEDLGDEKAALASLICRTNNQRYVDRNNTIVLVRHPLPYKTMTALLFIGRSDKFDSAAETLKDYMEVPEEEVPQTNAAEAKKSAFFNRKRN